MASSQFNSACVGLANAEYEVHGTKQGIGRYFTNCEACSYRYASTPLPTTHTDTYTQHALHCTAQCYPACMVPADCPQHTHGHTHTHTHSVHCTALHSAIQPAWCQLIAHNTHTACTALHSAIEPAWSCCACSRRLC
eukprot:1160279-Pelagomonas_calceolata.AAC.4